jgi:16S rRNA processing protein RimM
LPTDAGDEPILVGTVARAHGLHGEVVVDSYSDAPERFAPGSELSAALSAATEAPPRRLRVATSRPFQERLLVRFEGIENRTDAEALRGAELTVPRREVKPLPQGQHYRFELIGLEAATSAGERIGEVVEVFTTGSNDVFVVRGERGEILIPAIPGVIVSMDVAAGTITIDPPAGLPGWDER